MKRKDHVLGALMAGILSIMLISLNKGTTSI